MADENAVNKYKVTSNSDIRAAIKIMDQGGDGICVCVDESENVLGIITDGDFRRAILNGISLENNVQEMMNKDFIFLENNYTDEDVVQVFNHNSIKHIPILDRNKLVSLIKHDSFINKDIIYSSNRKLNVPVVIMAGGKGTRLAPFTNIFPKPLIPIGDKTIIELIIQEFYQFGILKFFFTINYKGEMIKAYFDSIEKNYEVNYVKEDDFFGTAGSLKLLEQSIDDIFIVTNCDIILKADYSQILEFHQETNSDLTIVSSLQHHKIPYGVVDFENGGKVIKITEKPEYSFTINTGVYILNKLCLEFIPEKTFFHMTDLIDSLIASGKNVFTYPVNENDYIDTGQWEEYQKAVAKLNFNSPSEL